MAELIGRRVRLHSLRSKPELNGELADVTSFDSASGRCAIRLHRIEKPLSLRVSNLDAVELERSPDGAEDSAALARFVSAYSIRASEKARHMLASEMRAGCALGGRWCCKSSSLWCSTCAANFVYSGVDETVADNIPSILGLPRCSFDGARNLPGELEAAYHLLERVAAFKKPMGQIVLDNLNAAELKFLRQVPLHSPWRLPLYVIMCPPCL